MKLQVSLSRLTLGLVIFIIIVLVVVFLITRSTYDFAFVGMFAYLFWGIGALYLGSKEIYEAYRKKQHIQWFGVYYLHGLPAGNCLVIGGVLITISIFMIYNKAFREASWYLFLGSSLLGLAIEKISPTSNKQ